MDGEVKLRLFSFVSVFCGRNKNIYPFKFPVTLSFQFKNKKTENLR